MPLDISCPHCFRGYTVPNKLLGKKIRCKTCETPFLVQPDREIEDYGEDPTAAAPVADSFWETSQTDDEPEPRRKRKPKSRQRQRPARRRSSWSFPNPFGLTFWLFAIAVGVIMLAEYTWIGGIVALIYGMVVIVMRTGAVQEGEISWFGYIVLRGTSLLLIGVGWFSLKGDTHWQREANTHKENEQHQAARAEERNSQPSILGQMMDANERISQNRAAGRSRSPFQSQPSSNSQQRVPPPTQNQGSVNSAETVTADAPPPEPDYFKFLPAGYKAIPNKVDIPDGTPILANDGRYWYKAVTTREVGSIRLEFYVEQDPARREVIRQRSELYIESSLLAKLSGEDSGASDSALARAREEFEKQVETCTAGEASYGRLPRGFQQVSPDLRLAETAPLLLKQGSNWVPVEVVSEEGELVKVHWGRDRFRDDEAVDRTMLWIHEDLLESMAAVVKLAANDAAGDPEPSGGDSESSGELDEDLRLQHAKITMARGSFPELPQEFVRIPSNLDLPAKTPLLAFGGSAWFPAEVLNDLGTRVDIHWVRFSAGLDRTQFRARLRIHQDLLKALRKK